VTIVGTMIEAIEIKPWQPDDRDAVIDLIVGIQQNEFNLAIAGADQPDLSAVDPKHSRHCGGPCGRTSMANTSFSSQRRRGVE
jgi:hypothetical protein